MLAYAVIFDNEKLKLSVIVYFELMPLDSINELYNHMAPNHNPPFVK